MKTTITLYTTPWCGDCRRAKAFLNRHSISFTEIDIETDEAAVRTLMDWTGGKKVIPTFHIQTSTAAFPVILHNPPHQQLADVLGCEAQS